MPEQQRLPQPEPARRYAQPPSGPRIRRTAPGSGLRLLGLKVGSPGAMPAPRRAGRCHSPLGTQEHPWIGGAVTEVEATDPDDQV